MNEQELILVIDDDPELLRTITGHLNGRYAARVAKSGETGLRALGGGALPDLILLDIDMPGMDGYEVLRRVREDPRTANIPVVFLTGLQQERFEQLGINGGAMDFLRKPVTREVLLARIKNYLRMARAMQGAGGLDEERLKALKRPLTEMEWKVVRLMAEFYKDKEIASKLNISVSRVKQLVPSILDKLELEERGEIRTYLK